MVKIQGHFGLLNNPYFEVLKSAKSLNNRCKHLCILKDMILKFKKEKKLSGKPSSGLNFVQKFPKLDLQE